MNTQAWIHVPPGYYDPVLWSTFPTPYEDSTGEDSVETATWCFGTTDCAAYQATAVCGRASISDPDINRSNVRTGNGPDNDDVCPG